MDRASSSFEPAREEAKSVPVLLFVSTSVEMMKRGVPRYTCRFFFVCGVDYLRCSEGADCYCGPDNAQLWLDGLRAGCKECFPLKEKMGRWWACQAIARGGRAVEVGPLRLLVVLPG